MTDFQSLESFCDGDKTFKGEEAQLIVLHGKGVIDADQDLVVSFGWFGSPEPDLVVSVIGSKEGNDFLQVQTFSRLVVSLKFRSLGRFEDDSYLLYQTS